MTFIHFYVRRSKVILPTVVQAEEGFYLDEKPVVMIPLAEKEKVIEALKEAIDQGNKLVPTPERADEPGSVVLDEVGIKRWEAFEKQSFLYTIHHKGDRISVYATGRADDGMWQRDKTSEHVFDSTMSIDEVIDFIIADVEKHPESTEKEQMLPMLLPAPESKDRAD